MPTEALNRTDFAKYLKRGHGRAMLHAKHHGLAGVGDLVLDVCLDDRYYDRQCEGSRASWLYAMLENQPQKQDIRQALLAALHALQQQADTEEEDENAPSIAQCCELSACFARSGDNELAALLRSLAQDRAFDWYRLYPHREWVKLDGLPALLEVARRAGHWLRQNPEDAGQGWPFLDSLLEECQLEQTGREALALAAKTDADIAAYLEYYSPDAKIEPDTASYTDRIRQEWPISRIIDDAYRHVGNSPGNYRRFGRHASPEELQLIWQTLLECKDEAACCRLLWVFHRPILALDTQIIPALDTRILGWLDSSHAPLRLAAIAALGRIQDERIAQAAAQCLQANPADHTLLPLLRLNAACVDNALFNVILQKLPTQDDDTAERIGSDLLGIAENGPESFMPTLLNWVYEHTPCGICRNFAVDHLHKRGLLTEQQLEECRNDADSSTREQGNIPQVLA